MTPAEAAWVTCPQCRRENPAAAKFCGECGAKLAAVCPACGASNPPDQKFCGECGSRLGAGVPAGTFAPPKSYTQTHLAQQVAIARGALEGERKQVTVCRRPLLLAAVQHNPA